MDSDFAVIAGKRFELNSLDVIRIVASRAGFDEVDVEAIGSRPGYTVTARARVGKEDAVSVSVTGVNYDECCEKFCSRVLT